MISKMRSGLSIFVLLLFIVCCPAATEGDLKVLFPGFSLICKHDLKAFAGPCCDIQVVSGQGSVDGIYTLKSKYVSNHFNYFTASLFLSSPTKELEEVCLDSCIYTKMGEEGDEYCFKGANIPGTTECSVRYFAEYFTSLFKKMHFRSFQQSLLRLTQLLKLPQQKT